MRLKHLVFLTLAAGLLVAAGKGNTTPEKLVEEYTKQAKEKDAAFKGFTAEAGKELFLSKHKNKKGEEVSCSGCHTTDPTKKGKSKANKDIDPIAPSANPERFTDAKHVEKWFKRNCDDVLERPCTPQEKGDFITYMMSVK